jgi:hypothetical protein
MTSVVPTAQSHVTVLQFLVNHGYHETAEVFKREASHYLEPHQLPMLLNPLAQNRTPSTAAVPLSIPPINDLSNPRTSR